MSRYPLPECEIHLLHDFHRDHYSTQLASGAKTSTIYHDTAIQIFEHR